MGAYSKRDNKENAASDSLLSLLPPVHSTPLVMTNTNQVISLIETGKLFLSDSLARLRREKGNFVVSTADGRDLMRRLARILGSKIGNRWCLG